MMGRNQGILAAAEGYLAAAEGLGQNLVHLEMVGQEEVLILLMLV
jgi:hypothetical protein